MSKYVAVSILFSESKDCIALHIISANGKFLITDDFRKLYQIYYPIVHVYEIDIENEILVLKIPSEWLEAKFGEIAHKTLDMPRLWPQLLKDAEVLDELPSL